MVMTFIKGLMGPYAATIAIAAATVVGVWFWSEQKADQRLKDFVREAAIAAAEKRNADQSTKDTIAKEIEDATIDDLRQRALDGGMFAE